MVRDHDNPRIAVVFFQDSYRFIYILYCMLCQDGDCDVTVRTLYRYMGCRGATVFINLAPCIGALASIARLNELVHLIHLSCGSVRRISMKPSFFLVLSPPRCPRIKSAIMIIGSIL